MLRRGKDRLQFRCDQSESSGREARRSAITKARQRRTISSRHLLRYKVTEIGQIRERRGCKEVCKSALEGQSRVTNEKARLAIRRIRSPVERKGNGNGGWWIEDISRARPEEEAETARANRQKLRKDDDADRRRIESGRFGEHREQPRF